MNGSDRFGFTSIDAEDVMAIDRVLLANYLAANFPGPGVRQRIQGIVDFVQQDEPTQQATIDAWSANYKTQLQAEKAEAQAAITTLDAKIAALK